jgi:hypothetical protein
VAHAFCAIVKYRGWGGRKRLMEFSENTGGYNNVNVFTLMIQNKNIVSTPS